MMSFHRLADLVLILHFGFLAFVVAGGSVVLRWPKAAWLHLPAVFWGALTEFSGWICPLTPLENTLRHRAGESGYTGGFIAHYITRVLYPEGLTRGIQIVLGVLVLALNGAIYTMLLVRVRRSRLPEAQRPKRTPPGA
jgi:hypothetical protein